MEIVSRKKIKEWTMDRLLCFNSCRIPERIWVCVWGGGGSYNSNYIERWYLRYFIVRQRKGEGYLGRKPASILTRGMHNAEQCFGSRFIDSGSGSSILGWIPNRIQGFDGQKFELFSIFVSFLPSWIRIRIPNPKHWCRRLGELYSWYNTDLLAFFNLSTRAGLQDVMSLTVM